MDNLGKKVFKNITNIIATITAILAIILAIIKLLSYSYWKGYLTYFNISSDFIRLNNDNIILELVFYGILIFALLFFYITTYELFDKSMERVANEKGILKKISTFIRQLLAYLFVSSIFMTSINIPLLWASVISFNITNGRSFIGSLVILYLIEMFSILSIWVTNFDKRKKKKDTEQDEEIKKSRLATKISLSIIIATFIVAGLYKLGVDSANKKMNLILLIMENI